MCRAAPEVVRPVQVDLTDTRQLVAYFSNPRWDAALQRASVDPEKLGLASLE